MRLLFQYNDDPVPFGRAMHQKRRVQVAARRIILNRDNQPRHNLAFKSPEGSAIASPASWGTAGRNFGAHIRSWGVGI
jgi:hypothetical protein